MALVGARQVGKTTLARRLGGHYFDLEQPEDRLRLDIRFDEISLGKKLVVLDEAQTWTEVFPRLRGTIDASRRRKGRFLLLGSVSPLLMREVAESLAGRLAIVELPPLASEEIPQARTDDLWVRGGYPAGGILSSKTWTGDWQRNYLTLLAQRDLPAWGLPARPGVTERLFRMLAALHGQLWNASAVGQGLGLSYHTVNSYLDFLEGSYLIRRLPPLTANLGKRLTKSPRVYLRDSGLLHALLRVDDLESLLGQPWVGASWEGWVIEQVLSHLSARGHPAEASFFRTATGDEIDLVLDLGRDRWAIEIKLSTSPDVRDLERLRDRARWIDATRVCLVSRTRRTEESARGLSTNLRGLLDSLDGSTRRK